MDPVTQTTTSMNNEASTTSNQTTTPVPTQNVVIAGAFWGTLPTPPQVSETMPAFSFDESDFWLPSASPTPNHESIGDPFAGWISSLQQTETSQTNTIDTSTLDTSTVLEATTEESDNQVNSAQDLDPISSWEVHTTETSQAETHTTPEGTISLDSLEEDIVEDKPSENNTEDTMVDFDIPSTTMWTDTSDTAQATTPVQQPTEDISAPESVPSFDLPVESVDHDTTVSLDVPEQTNDTTLPSAFDLPSIETNTDENTIPEDMATITMPQEIIELADTKEVNQDTVSDENTASEANNENNELNIQDTPIVASVDENRDNNDHELRESFDEFKDAFNTYTNFKQTSSLSLVWLRTDTDEVNYTFDRKNDTTITVNKSNNNDTLTFVETESGVQVLLNNESIGYYGVEQVDSDTTHYLKEKLGKFTMMLESEYQREEKKQREGIKKIKDTLKNF